MSIYDAIAPILISELVIILSFFDDRLIKPKVLAELSGARHLSEDQKDYIARMCSGASTLLMYFANLSIIVATLIIAIELVPHDNIRLVLIAITVTALPAFYFGLQIAVRFRLSDIDEIYIVKKLTRGDMLRVTLLIFNAAVMLMLIYAINGSRSSPSPAGDNALHAPG